MGTVAAYWGVGGILAVLGYAVVGLLERAARLPSYEPGWYHWVILVVVTALLVYAKSYRAFYLRLAPRVAERAAGLQRTHGAWSGLLAPLYCAGFFAIDRRAQVRMIAITLAMVVLIVIVRFLPEPWRAMLDLAIAVALALGFGFILAASVRSMRVQQHAP